MHSLTLVLAAIASAMALSACKERKPEPTCRETVKVFERNGQKVIQAVNGLYLREDFPFDACESRPFSEDPWARTLVKGGSLHFYWWRGRLIDTREYAALVRSGEPIDNESAVIQGGIGFHENEDDPARAFLKPRAWWYQPAIPHQHYPIDLLPNFGLDEPDPQAGIGPLKTKPTAYWAVRGSKNPRTGYPYVNNYCSMNPSPDWDGKDYSYQRNVQYLTQALTNEDRIGNTCRGSVTADNGKPIGGYVDVPGRGLPDIDKIYQAISKRLSQYTVE